MSEEKWNVVSLRFDKEWRFKESLVLSTDLSWDKAQCLCDQYEEKYRGNGQIYCVVPAGTIRDSYEQKES